MMELRPDLAIISRWIPENSTVLDLGCGDGALLARLRKEKDVTGYGLEIDNENIAACLQNGVNVVQQDIDQGLDNIPDKRFDYVLMTQALQAVHRPDMVIKEMLRVGREAIVTFPNFGHWRVRTYLAMHGRMPVSSNLPYDWYDTPNIHLCTVHDFDDFCADNGISVLQSVVMDRHHRSGILTRMVPNLFGEVAIYRVSS